MNDYKLNPEELIVGNLLEWNGYEVEVITIDKDGSITCQGDRVYPNDEYELRPLNLNSELLTRFGFNKLADIDNHDFHYEVYEKNGVRLLAYLGNFDNCTVISTNSNEWEFDLSFVHTLQNVWYHLTLVKLIII